MDSGVTLARLYTESRYHGQLLHPQAIEFDGALLKELQGDVSDKIALTLLKELGLSRMPSSSVIHDNGCGYGAVTMAVMAAEPPAGVQIHATDINEMYLAELKATLAKNPTWPVKIETMDACALTFPDNTFDLSVATFVFAGLADDVAAASHVRRTLKPGRTGVIAVWKDMPWHAALENAHYKIRGADEPMAPFLSMTWYKKNEVAKDAEAGGWSPDELEFVEKAEWLNLGPDLKRWATIAWSFLAKPAGGWQQRDEDRWDEAVDSIVEELGQDAWHKVEDGVHKIRMVADVTIMRKQG
ncbi:s-adenosyl-l-methionine-dependent methyltransferase [Apiospora hydei]|uniref:S-adenosyl-l-methionine-dependent methyltransferase n=1 Tax=Apiospora hydei TaxID=1337664 RepID=A0ABR1VVV1_9PEZI